MPKLMTVENGTIQLFMPIFYICFHLSTFEVIKKMIMENENDFIEFIVAIIAAIIVCILIAIS